MNYIAINKTRKTAYDIGVSHWSAIFMVHPDTLKYRADPKNMRDSVAAGLYLKPAKDLNLAQLAIVDALAQKLNTFGIQDVCSEDIAINNYGDYILTDSVYPDVDVKLKNAIVLVKSIPNIRERS